jgi:hypothetical protein
VDDELFDKFGHGNKVDFGKVESPGTDFAALVEVNRQRLRLKAEAPDIRAIEFEFRV